jgi:hypothetical protein
MKKYRICTKSMTKSRFDYEREFSFIFHGNESGARGGEERAREHGAKRVMERGRQKQREN